MSEKGNTKQIQRKSCKGTEERKTNTEREKTKRKEGLQMIGALVICGIITTGLTLGAIFG